MENAKRPRAATPHGPSAAAVLGAAHRWLSRADTEYDKELTSAQEGLAWETSVGPALETLSDRCHALLHPSAPATRPAAAVPGSEPTATMAESPPWALGFSKWLTEMVQRAGDGGVRFPRATGAREDSRDVRRDERDAGALVRAELPEDDAESIDLGLGAIPLVGGRLHG